MDPSSQPLFNLKGWLRVTGGVRRSRVLGFNHSFDPLAAQYTSSSQASRTQTWSDAVVEDIVSQIFVQRLYVFRQSIHDILIDLFRDPTLRDQLASLSHPSQQVNVLLNLFYIFKILYFYYL